MLPGLGVLQQIQRYISVGKYKRESDTSYLGIELLRLHKYALLFLSSAFLTYLHKFKHYGLEQK